jgi:hypothetical protein
MYLTGHEEQASVTEIKRVEDFDRFNGHMLQASFENQFNLSIDPNQIRPSEVQSPSGM